VAFLSVAEAFETLSDSKSRRAYDQELAFLAALMAWATPRDRFSTCPRRDLGSNIGTTTTSILASFAAEGRYLKPSIQISLVHLLFNISGILLFYPIPFMRWPVGLAQMLGDITATYRWFAGLYLAVMFVFAPLFVFLLSLAGTQIMYSVLCPLMVITVIVVLINVIQNHRSHWLPYFIRDWSFLPLPMRSLKPLDDLFSQMSCCSKCINPQLETEMQIIPDMKDVESGNIL